jgi:hypothetical protein
MPSRPTPSARYRPGDNLVKTADGWTEYARDTAIEQYGPRKGLRIRKDELDEPGYSDLPRPELRVIAPQVVTDDVPKPKQAYATDGTGIPLDGDGNKMY